MKLLALALAIILTGCATDHCVDGNKMVPNSWHLAPPEGPDTARKVDAQGRPNFGPQ